MKVASNQVHRSSLNYASSSIDPFVEGLQGSNIDEINDRVIHGGGSVVNSPDIRDSIVVEDHMHLERMREHGRDTEVSHREMTSLLAQLQRQTIHELKDKKVFVSGRLSLTFIAHALEEQQ